MSQPVTVTDLHQAGRAKIAELPTENVAYSHNADFSAASAIELDFTIINQSQIFGIVKSLFVDNGTSPNPIDVTVSITGQRFTIPAYAIGFFPITAAIQSKITLDTLGGATKPTTITVHNYDIPGNVWYSYGTLNLNTVLPSQGTMAEGTNVAGDPDNNPVYIGGIDRGTGLFHGISVDATGRINGNVVVDTTTPLDANVANFPAQQGAYIDGSISLSGASELLLAANPARRILIINNPNATNSIGINLVDGVAAIGSAGTIVIKAGERFVLDSYPPTGKINVIGTAADIVVAYEG